MCLTRKCLILLCKKKTIKMTTTSSTTAPKMKMANRTQTTTKTVKIAAVHQSSRQSHANEAEAALPHVPVQTGTLRNLVLAMHQSLVLHAEREDARQALADRAVVSEADREEALHMPHVCPSTNKEI